MFSFGSGTNFDKLLDKATSHLSLEPDFTSIIAISDVIRQQDCAPKYAISGIKKKLVNQNPHTVGYAILVLESVVKNCGPTIHDEVATKAFMEVLHDLLKINNSNEQIKQKILELIQAWSFAFRSVPKYKAVQDMMATLKAEGYKFPVLKESDAMFSAETAPGWVDATNCHHCRALFSMVNRKHHCRACGNVFCNQCSDKNLSLPKFGIEKIVRVCITCFEQNKNRATSPKTEVEQLPVEYLNSSLAQQKQAPKATMSAEELKEEEEYNLAIALSQSEAEAKEMEKKRPAAESNSSSFRNSPPSVQKDDEEGEDPELARYLNRSYWEQKQGRPADRNKTSSPDRYRSSPPSAPQTPTHQMENGFSESQLTEFVTYLKTQVEIFVNRMKSNSSRGRSISTDSSVQGLFMNMTDNHSKLLEFISQQEELRVYFEGLQDKLAQVKDALAALEALRDEHQEKMRREAEEAEKLKQKQMAQKLEIMRKKKQEYLQHQRQLAIQRVQEQEREMMMRKEQKQYMMSSGMGSHYMMGGYPPQNPGYPHPGAMQPPPGYQQLPQGQNYMPQGFPPGGMHPNMAMGHHMQPGMVGGPQSLPQQMPPHMHVTGGMQQQQPMTMAQPHGAMQPQSLPPGMQPMHPQHPMQHNVAPMHPNLQHHNVPPMQQPNIGNLPPHLQNPQPMSAGQPPTNLPPHGIPGSIPQQTGPASTHPSMMPMYPGGPNPHSPMAHMQTGGMPMGMGPSGPRMMQQGPQGMGQYPPPPHNPQGQTTAELIRFD